MAAMKTDQANAALGDRPSESHNPAILFNHNEKSCQSTAGRVGQTLDTNITSEEVGALVNCALGRLKLSQGNATFTYLLDEIFEGLCWHQQKKILELMPRKAFDQHVGVKSSVSEQEDQLREQSKGASYRQMIVVGSTQEFCKCRTFGPPLMNNDIDDEAKLTERKFKSAIKG
jgi:hypothetical protein